MGETSVNAVSAQSSRNVVMIEATAMKIGTIARNEANTNASTASAPAPPISASTRTPGPLSPPLSCWSASNPVRWTGAPATLAPRSVARAFFSASGLSPNG
jgi:hypothetical protein